MSSRSEFGRNLRVPAMLLAASQMIGCAQEQYDPVANAPRDNTPAAKAIPREGSSGVPKGPGDNGAGIYTQPDYPGYAERHGNDKAAAKSSPEKPASDDKKTGATPDVKSTDNDKKTGSPPDVKPSGAPNQNLPELTQPK